MLTIPSKYVDLPPHVSKLRYSEDQFPGRVKFVSCYGFTFLHARQSDGLSVEIEVYTNIGLAPSGAPDTRAVLITDENLLLSALVWSDESIDFNFAETCHSAYRGENIVKTIELAAEWAAELLAIEETAEA